MAGPSLVWGPTYAEMLDHAAIPSQQPADGRELFDITWMRDDGTIRCLLLDSRLTGVEPNVIVLCGSGLPTGSHKVGAAYSVALELQLSGAVHPSEHTLVWPSTGNYGIAGAWVGSQLGYESIVVIPEEMSRERFEMIQRLGAHLDRTSGGESARAIYDRCHQLSGDPRMRIMNQFDQFANYRFHHHVTGNSVIRAVRALAAGGVGNGRAAAFVSAMGSGGTIAAGDRLKQEFGECRIVGLEPVQCPTLYANGYGEHRIQGIGDSHVTWIHNVLNMDAIMCIDQRDCERGLRLMTQPAGAEFLASLGLSSEQIRELGGLFGLSGICNVIGAVRTARFYGLGPGDNVVTVATDGVDRYGSVLDDLERTDGPLDEGEARASWESIFQRMSLDWVEEGTVVNRQRWHNLKYFTWVEQQGKDVADLDAQRSVGWWIEQQQLAAEIDDRLIEARGG